MVTELRTWQQSEIWFSETCARLAEESDGAYRRNISDPLYAYFKPNGLSVVVVRDSANGGKCPEGYELVTSERVPGHLTKIQLSGWFRERLKRTPLFPIEIEVRS